MSIAAVAHSGGSSVGSLALYSQIGVGIGGIFVAALLVYLLGYTQVLEASERDDRRLRLLLVSAILPLQFAFVGLIAFESFRIIGLL